jgi:RNA polymerase sigma-70 factor (ECF subfamily)
MVRKQMSETIDKSVSEIIGDQLLTRARAGDQDALQQLFAERQAGLFRFLYRMLGNRADAEDLLQECWIRGQRGIGGFREGASALKAWWFGIASHLALDYLRQRKRWRVEAQLFAEQETDAQPDELEGLSAMMSEPDFRYEVKEHVAFCFTCVGRTLGPDEEASLLLREVFEFSNAEAARMLGVSEPILRHKLSSARRQMTEHFDGLCQLINKTGLCYQCVTLGEFAPEGSRSELITRIEPAELSEALLDGRIAMVKAANLEYGGTAKLHAAFFQSISAQEEERKD